MKEIDWSKAPEDATHCVPEEYLECAKCWIKFDGVIWFYYYPYADAGWKLWPKTSVDKASHLFIERPKEQAWDGRGLPPVGTVCEVQRSNMRWYRCKIFAVRGREALFDLESDCSDSWDSADLSCFRPIKTQEQLAAEEEREKAIDAIYDILYTSNTWTTAAVALYDAGYRLTKIEE